MLEVKKIMAANEKLILYIKQQFREGFSGESIRSFLLKAGWKGDDIEQAFAAALAVKPIQSNGEPAPANIPYTPQSVLVKPGTPASFHVMPRTSQAQTEQKDKLPPSGAELLKAKPVDTELSQPEPEPRVAAPPPPPAHPEQKIYNFPNPPVHIPKRPEPPKPPQPPVKDPERVEGQKPPEMQRTPVATTAPVRPVHTAPSVAVQPQKDSVRSEKSKAEPAVKKARFGTAAAVIIILAAALSVSAYKLGVLPGSLTIGGQNGSGSKTDPNNDAVPTRIEGWSTFTSSSGYSFQYPADKIIVNESEQGVDVSINEEANGFPVIENFFSLSVSNADLDDLVTISVELGRAFGIGVNVESLAIDGKDAKIIHVGEEKSNEIYIRMSETSIITVGTPDPAQITQNKELFNQIINTLDLP